MEVPDCETNKNDLKYFQSRLRTFNDWPSQIRPDKFALAQSGFVYLGKSDMVKCFCCGIVCHEWKTDDNAWLEHQKHSQNCEYINMVGLAPAIEKKQSHYNYGSGSMTGANLFVKPFVGQT